ncbi:winged helix-turn-helix domain-containing protein [Falsiroseomonas oryziterrae]|uniref:winged helix-turn-helix domain-containing protein n=1 Tax=Falsiroseomonas oryziterrae TaxID=2911368 RepID=UPI001F0024BB|nr:winged helix-turn-helix domain-containing protein [Roseomonas sp. NPKOSM-4]
MASLVAVPSPARVGPQALTRSLGVWLFDGFAYDEGRALLTRPDGLALMPRPKTELVLMLLLRRAGSAVSRTELLDAVWPGSDVGDDNVTQCITELRRAFGERAGLLKTVQRCGYCLDAEVAWRPSG